MYVFVYHLFLGIYHYITYLFTGVPLPCLKLKEYVKNLEIFCWHTIMRLHQKKQLQMPRDSIEYSGTYIASLKQK